MLKIIGRQYITEHCVREMERIREERMWKNYVADGLWVISQQNKRIVKRWTELINPAEVPKQSAKEIISGLQSKLGGQE